MARAAAKSRISVLETLSAALPVLTRDLPGAPDPDVLRNDGSLGGPIS